MTKRGLPVCTSWGVKGSAADASASLNIDRTTLDGAEAPGEQAVSAYLSAMPFLWIAVEDEPAPVSLRGLIERNAIGLLSNYGRIVLDPPSPGWLGYASNRARVSASGLWNQRHADEAYDPAFLDTLELIIAR